MDRRQIMRWAVGAGIGTVMSQDTAGAAPLSYSEAVRATWASLRQERRHRELVRFATLAANSHNTQPWRFTVGNGGISIAPDFARRCPAVDPDDHHLFVSLGCATENMVHAAAALGLNAIATFEDGKVVVTLDEASPVRTALLEAITVRQCTRAQYDGKPIPNGDIALLERAGVEPGVSLMLITDRRRFSNVIEYVLQGNSAQMHDNGFMSELKEWMRFNEADAVAKMDGLFSAASGNPTLPSWLAQPLLGFFFTEANENKKYREHIESSSGIAVFVTESDDRRHWIAAGRACQRFALQATALGLKYAFINQPVEVPYVRRQFASYLGLGSRRPDLVLRFGFGPQLPRSLRRPPEQVMA